jgi:hypothetical protein
LTFWFFALKLSNTNKLKGIIIMSNLKTEFTASSIKSAEDASLSLLVASMNAMVAVRPSADDLAVIWAHAANNPARIAYVQKYAQQEVYRRSFPSVM